MYECRNAPDCGIHHAYHVLDRKANAYIIYTSHEEVHRCHSVPTTSSITWAMAWGSVAPEDGEYRWRILYLKVPHLSRVDNWDAESRIAAELSPDHWRVLEEAVDCGYYLCPHEVAVEGLSGVLDEPDSTVQYRLRTAEDFIICQFADATL